MATVDAEEFELMLDGAKEYEAAMERRSADAERRLQHHRR